MRPYTQPEYIASLVTKFREGYSGGGIQRSSIEGLLTDVLSEKKIKWHKTERHTNLSLLYLMKRANVVLLYMYLRLRFLVQWAWLFTMVFNVFLNFFCLEYLNIGRRGFLGRPTFVSSLPPPFVGTNSNQSSQQLICAHLVLLAAEAKRGIGGRRTWMPLLHWSAFRENDVKSLGTPPLSQISGHFSSKRLPRASCWWGFTWILGGCQGHENHSKAEQLSPALCWFGGEGTWKHFVYPSVQKRAICLLMVKREEGKILIKNKQGLLCTIPRIYNFFFPTTHFKQWLASK